MPRLEWLLDPDPGPTAGWESRILSVLRIAVGLLFMQHGTQKLFAFPTDDPAATPVALGSLSGAAGVLEVFGGALVVLGLLTRPVALVLAVEMLVAYVLRHAPRGAWPILNRGELAALYLVVYLYLTVRGAGAWSVDALLHRGRNAS